MVGGRGSVAHLSLTLLIPSPFDPEFRGGREGAMALGNAECLLQDASSINLVVQDWV
jgi:hypothetical protein